MKTETGYKCIVLDNEHGRSYYDAVKETWCKGVVVLTQKTVDAVLPKLKSKEIIAPLISVIDDPRFNECCCESKCGTGEALLGTSNCCPVHNVNPHACYASPKCIPTPSHSAETTEKEWTYVIGSEGCTVRHHDKPKFYELTINEAIEICDKFNSYHQLQSDNEAKEKRIRELEINFTEAVANIQNLNQCLDKMWNSRSSYWMSEANKRNITEAQKLSAKSVEKYNNDTLLTPPIDTKP